MSVKLQLDFQLNDQSYHIDFKQEEAASSENSVLIGGRYYAIEGPAKAAEVVRICLTELPSDSTENLEKTGVELKAKLWQSGAKEIAVTLADKTHKVGSRALGKASFNLAKIVKNICKLMEAHYYYHEVAKKCATYIRQQADEGAYDAISDPNALSQALNADLRLISEDKHLYIGTDPSHPDRMVFKHREPYPLPELAGVYSYKSKLDSPSSPPEIKSGFLVADPEVGYIDLRTFNDCAEDDVLTKIAKMERHVQRLKDQRDHTKKGKRGRGKKGRLTAHIDSFEKRLSELNRTFAIDPNARDMIEDIRSRKKAFIHVVQSIAKAKSIIIDLRNNGGGDPFAVQFLCSLFMDEGLPLAQLEERKGDTIEVRKLYTTLSRKELSVDVRLLKTPLFILLGPRTFSCAEEFSYIMKILGRGTLVGEPSMGGANPGGMHSLGQNFEIFIPWGRTVDPLEGGSWEGVGVIPDHMVPATEALDQALQLIQSQ